MALSDLLALEDLADTHIHRTEVIDIDLLLNRLYRIRIAIDDLLLFRFILLAKLGNRHLLFFSLRCGEIKQSHVTVLIDRIEEEIKSRSLFLIEEQLVNTLEKCPLKLFQIRRILTEYLLRDCI